MAKLTDTEIDELTATTLRIAKATRRTLRERGVKLTSEQYATLAGSIAGRLVRSYLGDEPSDPPSRLN
jgi:hypothetical protein